MTVCGLCRQQVASASNRRNPRLSGEGEVFSTWDFRSRLYRVAIHPNSVVMTRFITPQGLSQLLTILQVHASAHSAVVHLVQCITAGWDSIRMYPVDAIVLEPTPTRYLESNEAFLSRLKEDSFKLPPEKYHVGATTVDLLGHTVCSSGLRPDGKPVGPWRICPYLLLCSSFVQ